MEVFDEMRTRQQSYKRWWALAFVGACCAAFPLVGQTYTPAPIPLGDYDNFPYSVTGIITSPKGSGSGAVARHPRLVFSCAHVVFDSSAVDPWLSDVRWYRRYGGNVSLSEANGQLLRGYFYFSGYSSAARIALASLEAYSQELVVHFSYEQTANGGYAGWFDDGVSPLQSTAIKLITGYPAGLYATGDSRRNQMHQTGPFTRPFTTISGPYLQVLEVSTGPGNSGGPIWVRSGNEYRLAGLMVSYFSRSLGHATDLTGAYGLDSLSRSLIDKAIAASTPAIAAPSIIAQPTSRRVIAGASASFSVTASGSALSYRWLKDGTTLPGATNATLTIPSVTLSHSGTYQVIVSNSGGEVASAIVTLTVDSAPVIFAALPDQSVSPAQSVSFSASVAGSPPFTFQWFKNGAAIPGATAASYTISLASELDVGWYVYVVRNSFGSATSSVATLTLRESPRLGNLSVRSSLAVGQRMAVGLTVGGGSRSVLVRAAGPALAGFGISEYLYDPKIVLRDARVYATIAENDNWVSSSELTAMFSRLGAFGFFAGSRDAAMMHTLNGGNTVEISGTSSGVVLVEAYDAGTGGTGRLTNISARNRVGVGPDILIVGFYINGRGTARLLIRAIGPGLVPLGVTGVLSDPKLTIHDAFGMKLSENDNWDASLAATFRSVGAFAVASGSKDSALVIELGGGRAFTVQVSGVNGTEGEALVELYELP